MKTKILDTNGNVWIPYNFSDDYFYCVKLDKIEWIKYIAVKEWI